MTRETLEKELKKAGVPDYIYNLTGQGKRMSVYVWKKLVISGGLLFGKRC